MARTDPSPPPSPGVDPRFQILLTLISLQKGIRRKSRKTELEFMMVNQTFNLLPYRHCIYWEIDSAGVEIRAASGLVQVDPHGPYTLWLKNFLAGQVRGLLAKSTQEEKADLEPESVPVATTHLLTAADCSPEDMREWAQWVSPHALILAFRDEDGTVRGGLWMDRDKSFDQLEIALLEDLGDAYGHALLNFDKKDGRLSVKKAGRSLFRWTRMKTRVVLLALLAVMCLPVRMSVTAPAEIVAREPYVVSIPFDGTLEKVEVAPGQTVRRGDVLARMDSTMLRNRADVVSREMETAIVAYGKTEREAFTDKTKLAEIAILKSQVDQKAAEKKYAEELLARAEIRAEKDGVVIFADANALRGKPVQTGEQIMLLADPADSQLLIRVPVDSMIEIDESVPARFFLNVMPLGFREAIYESIGYQASPDPDGLLTYKVRAGFEAGAAPPRIGWTGSGKIYGQRTIMAFNILRRPLVTLRRKIGF